MNVTTNKYHLMRGDCLERMAEIPDGSIDMVLCDLPYGTTACKWDSVIPFEPLWAQYRRVCKRNAAIVLTASQPFTSALVMSNIDWFKYEVIWEKDSPTNPFMAEMQIMKRHENVCVFYQKQPTFNPQMTERKKENRRNNNPLNKYQTETKGDAVLQRKNIGNDGLTYPSSVQKFTRGARGLHPTQKPVALMEYLVRTYTNEGETVLDNTMGSGTTGVACARVGRRFVGIERDEGYFEIARKRIEEEISNLCK